MHLYLYNESQFASLCVVLTLLTAVIALLTWPYIEYHGLGSKVNAHVQTRFPQAMDKARSLWVRLKKFGKSNTVIHLNLNATAKGS